MLTIKRFLRQLNKTALINIFNQAELSNDEFQLVKCAYIEKRMRDSTYIKMSIGRTKYNTMLNSALIKIKIAINNMNKVRIFE